MTLSLLLAAAVQAAPVTAVLDCDAQDRGYKAALSAKLPQPRASYRLRLTGYASLCRGWTVVDVVHGSAAGLPDRVRWAVRRQRMDAGGRLTTEWLDSTRCPALYDWLEQLDRISVAIGLGPSVRPPAPGPLPTPPAPPPEDGTGYHLRLNALQPDGSYAQVDVASNYGALQRWAKEGLSALTPCWRPAP